MIRIAGLRVRSPRRFFGRQRFRCSCVTLEHPEWTGPHLLRCSQRWATWNRRQRLCMMLLYWVPVGGTTNPAVDGTLQYRPMTFAEHLQNLTAPPANDAELPRWERFERQVHRDALKVGMSREAPSWKHLGARVVLLLWEFLVRVRRILKWLAPILAAIPAVCLLARACASLGSAEGP